MRLSYRLFIYFCIVFLGTQSIMVLTEKFNLSFFKKKKSGAFVSNSEYKNDNSS